MLNPTIDYSMKESTQGINPINAHIAQRNFSGNIHSLDTKKSTHRKNHTNAIFAARHSPTKLKRIIMFNFIQEKNLANVLYVQNLSKHT